MPHATPSPDRNDDGIDVKRDQGQRQERQRQLRGLILLAVAAITFGILRAGVHRVFTPGWWRLW